MKYEVGGYGGAGFGPLYAASSAIDVLLDATHPYAAQISRNAAWAARACGIECWALRRPVWQPQPRDDWREVADWDELVTALTPFKRPLFTLGKEPLAHLHEIPADQFWIFARAGPVSRQRTLQGHRRPRPFRIDDERRLFEQQHIDVLISKNSGSSTTEPKLEVARERGVRVDPQTPRIGG